MSQENVEIARRCFDAWSRWAIDEIAACYAPDAEIVSPESELFGHTYTGREGLRLYIEHFTAVFEPPAFELEEILDAGDQGVVSVVRLRARGTRSGVEVADRTASVFTIRDGVISRQVIYVDRAEALEAVGLSE
jgi:ketosteroid isomerase-like protein